MAIKRYDNTHRKDRNRDMLYLYVDDRLTLDEIGKVYGISRERVRQVIGCFGEYKTFQALRKELNKINKELIESLSCYRKDDKAKRKFWYNIDVGKDDECWEWIGCKHNISKYGRVTNRRILEKYNLGYPDYAHRVMWCVWNGKEIPDGLWVLHKCNNESCVNPHHLYVGSPQDNVNDRESTRVGINRHGL